MGAVRPRVLAIAALPGEAAVLRRRLRPATRLDHGACAIWQGPLAGCALTLIVSGVGRARALAALEYALAAATASAAVAPARADPLFPWKGARVGARPTTDHAPAQPASGPPDLVLSFGVAGALSPSVALGRVYACDPLLAPGAPPRNAAPELLACAGLPPAACLTVPEPALTPHAKAGHRAAHGALLVEMESYWIAEACAARGIPALALRAAVDAHADDLSGLPDPDRPGLLPLAGFALANPRLAARLARRMAVCSRGLANAVETVCRALAADPCRTSGRAILN